MPRRSSGNVVSDRLSSWLGTAGTIIGGIYGGPAGAAIGTKIGSSVGGGTSSSAPIGGGNSTPTGANANPTRYGVQSGAMGTPVQMSKGGYTCYADGGVAHDHAICMKLGGHVGGEAKVEGDSEENDDTVPAMLKSLAKLVIPRSVPKTEMSMEEIMRRMLP